MNVDVFCFLEVVRARVRMIITKIVKERIVATSWISAREAR